MIRKLSDRSLASRDRENRIAKARGLQIRDDTMDGYIVYEVAGSYGWMGGSAEDVFMDVGGNIGAVSRWFLDRGCRVVAYEPEPDNAALFRVNAPEAEFHEVALVVDDAESASLSVSEGANKATHTLLDIKGRPVIQVRALNFQSELDRVRPTILKVDIEGYEHVLLDAVRIPESVRLMTIEFDMRRAHQRVVNETHGMNLVARRHVMEMIDRLMAQGFHIELKNALRDIFTYKTWDMCVRFSRDMREPTPARYSHHEPLRWIRLDEFRDLHETQLAEIAAPAYEDVFEAAV